MWSPLYNSIIRNKWSQKNASTVGNYKRYKNILKKFRPVCKARLARHIIHEVNQLTFSVALPHAGFHGGFGGRIWTDSDLWCTYRCTLVYLWVVSSELHKPQTCTLSAHHSEYYLGSRVPANGSQGISDHNFRNFNHAHPSRTPSKLDIQTFVHISSQTALNIALLRCWSSVRYNITSFWTSPNTSQATPLISWIFCLAHSYIHLTSSRMVEECSCVRYSCVLGRQCLVIHQLKSMPQTAV